MRAREKLKCWMRLTGLHQEQFGERVGVKQSTVAKWLKGDMRPSWAKLRRIHDVTNGFVRPDDWLPEPEEEAAMR